MVEKFKIRQLCLEQACAIAYFEISIIKSIKLLNFKRTYLENNLMDSTRTLSLRWLYIAFIDMSPKLFLACISKDLMAEVMQFCRLKMNKNANL